MRGRARCPPGAGRGRTFLVRNVLDAPPGEAPRAPGRPLGVPSASRTHLRGPVGTQVRGRGRASAPPPAASGAGAGPPSASPVRPPPCLTGPPPSPAAGRELPGDRGSGCCPPVRPLSRCPLPLPLPPGPCPPVYMPVKPPAAPSPSEPWLPEGKASRPANWTYRSDLGSLNSELRRLCRLRHHLGGILLWCFEEGGCGVGKGILGISGSPPYFGLRGFRLRELAHGFLDEEEEIQIPNHFHPGRTDCGPLRERGPLLQGPAAGWRGFCQLVVKVGAGAVALEAEGDGEQDLATWQVWKLPWGPESCPLGRVCTR